MLVRTPKWRQRIRPAAATKPVQPVRGGKLRVAMTVRPWTDPRRFEWSELANISRQCNEHLVRWRRDFTFEGRLLERDAFTSVGYGLGVEAAELFT